MQEQIAKSAWQPVTQEERDAYTEQGYAPLYEGDYQFLREIEPVLENDPDPRATRDRLLAASVYASKFNIPLDAAYLNLEEISRQYAGKEGEKGLFEAAVDSVGFALEAANLNNRADTFRRTKDPGERERLLTEIRQIEADMERLKDKAPKVWEDAYIKQGGWADISAFGRSVLTGALENSVSLGIGIAAGAVTGGLAAGAVALMPKLAIAKAVAGLAPALGVGVSAGLSTRGLMYWEIYDTYKGQIPEDIMAAHADTVAFATGAAEALLGGVVGGAVKNLFKMGFGGAVNKAVSKWFVSGKMVPAAMMLKDWAGEVLEEGLTEGFETGVEAASKEAALDEAEKRRENLEAIRGSLEAGDTVGALSKAQELGGEAKKALAAIYAQPIEDTLSWLEKELEAHPEIDREEAEGVFRDIWESFLGAMGSSALTGGLSAFAGFSNNLKTAAVIGAEAKEAPNAQAFINRVREHKAAGMDIPGTENLSPEDESEVLREAYENIRAREGGVPASPSAEAIAETADLSESEIVEETADFGEGEGDTRERLEHGEDADAAAAPVEGREYHTARDDGTLEIRFYAGDTARAADDGKAVEYGNIRATAADGEVRIESFQMKPRYEAKRAEVFARFAELHAGEDIVWNPEHEENLAIRARLEEANPRGPRNGLNWAEGAPEGAPEGGTARGGLTSEGAVRVASAIRKAAPGIDGLEAALTVEAFGFMKGEGETLDQAFGRLGIRFTDQAPAEVKTAQREGRTVKGATWVEKTAEGMKRFVYLNKRNADAGSIAHELGHIVAPAFTDDEVRTLAAALNGFKLKDGRTVSFDGDAITAKSFQANRAQMEAFSEGLEQYLLTGKAPDTKSEGLFERIKAFMKRLYEKMKGWGDLSPQAEAFYQKVFGGEIGGGIKTLKDGAPQGAATPQGAAGSQTREEGPGGARGAETGNEAAGVEGTQGEGAGEAAAGGVEGIIGDESLPPTDRAEAVFEAAARAAEEAAGRPLFQDEADARTERRARVEAIKNIEPKTYTQLPEISKQDIKNYFKSFGYIENKTGPKPIKARFSKSVAGKMIGDQGITVSTLAPYYKELFENAIYAYGDTERENQETRLDGLNHKRHPDITEYHNFVNKFIVRDAESNAEKRYFIRFTVTEKKNDNLIHSAFISSVEIYGESGPINSRFPYLAKEPLTRTDDRLAEFFNPGNPSGVEDGTLFQEGARDIVKEARTFGSWEEWRDFVEVMESGDLGEYGAETAGLSGPALDAWYKAFYENAMKDDEGGGADAEAEAAGERPRGTPAELDKEFLDILKEPLELDGFIEAVRGVYGDAPEDAEGEALVADMERVFSHPDWQMAIRKGNGKVAEGQRKRLFGHIRANPRDYRGIYARLAGLSELEVREGESQAEGLKYELGDRLSEDIAGLSPEKLAALAEGAAEDEFAELLASGKATFAHPGEKRYIRERNKQIKELESAAAEAEKARSEEDAILGRVVGKELLETFDRVVKLKEGLRRQSERLEQALKRNSPDAAKAARVLRTSRASFNTVLSELEALARARRLEAEVREALSDERVSEALAAQREVLKSEAERAVSARKALDDAAMTAKIGEADAKLAAVKEEYRAYVKSARSEARLTERLARRAGAEQMKSRLSELHAAREAQKAETQAKRSVIRRIFRRPNPREVNHEQGQAIAFIQRLFDPSLVDVADRFINGVETPYLREAFSRFKTDAEFRESTLKGRLKSQQMKIREIMNAKRFEELTDANKRYLLKALAKNGAEGLDLSDVVKARENAFNRAGAEEADRIVRKYLPDTVYYRIQEKPLDQWTLAEGEELAKIIDKLADLGKLLRKADVEAENQRVEYARRAVADAVKGAIPASLRDKAGDSAETLERKRKGREELFNRYGVGGTALEKDRKRKARSPLLRYNDMDNERFVKYILDGGNAKGANYALLVKRANEAFNKKGRSADGRLAAVTRVMAETKTKTADLYQEGARVNLGGDIGEAVFTVAELMGVLMAGKNSYSAEALVYGNLMSKLERQQWQDGEIDYDAMRGLAESRAGILKEKALVFFARPENKKYAAIMAAMERDLSDNTARLNRALIAYNNNEMMIEEFYYPMQRTEPVSAHIQNSQLLREMTGSAAGPFQAYVEKGFTKSRVDISPAFQTPINLDAFQVWTNAVEKQEHFIAYGQLAKEANRIYKDPNSVARTWIDRRFGQAGVQRVERLIADLVSPEGQKTRNALDETLQGIRRNYAAAVLGWRVTPIVKQFLTSPGAFLAEMTPMEYWGAFVKYGARRAEMWAEIEALSPYMKQRSANMMVKEAREAAANAHDKMGRVITTINKTGMVGLELVDNLCVAPGWWVLYNRELTRVTGEDTKGWLSLEKRQAKAAAYADEIIKRTQPSGDAWNIAPLFKDNGVVGKAFLQFQQSMNVVWQQTRYDLPDKIRNKQYKQAAGQIIGYAMAGLLAGLVTVGFGDDDDEEERNRKMLSWATSQFTDTIPIAGGAVSDLVETAITGKTAYRRTQDLVPALTTAGTAAINLVRAIQDADGAKAAKAFEWAAKTGGYVTGLPVVGALEAARFLGGLDGE